MNVGHQTIQAFRHWTPRVMVTFSHGMPPAQSFTLSIARVNRGCFDASFGRNSVISVSPASSPLVVAHP
jgi:hypothetical protein